MKKIIDMTMGEVGQFVEARANCALSDRATFTPPVDSERTSERDLRKEAAAAICGSCSVRPACERLAAYETDASLTGSVHGGKYFGSNRVYDLVTEGCSQPVTRNQWRQQMAAKYEQTPHVNS